MKQTLIKRMILLAVFLAGVWTAYSLGRHRGYNLGLVLDQKGAFVGSLDALQKIRAGNIDEGARRLEATCFAAANTVYSDHPETRFIARTFFDDLKHYRQTYRTNSADWSVAEQNLEQKLADWK